MPEKLQSFAVGLARISPIIIIITNLAVIALDTSIIAAHGRAHIRDPLPDLGTGTEITRTIREVLHEGGR